MSSSLSLALLVRCSSKLRGNLRKSQLLSGSEFHTGTPAFMLTDVLHSTSLKRDSQISLRVQDPLFSPKFSGNFLLIYPLIQGPSGFPSLILKQFRA